MYPSKPHQVSVSVSLQLPCLSSYTPYCSNQVKAKALLDQKKQDRRVQDFLQRCRQSPFSRKLDLWNFLDIPRSRLVKYPLLLREILKHTPNDHPDRQHLDEAVRITNVRILYTFVLQIWFTQAVWDGLNLLTLLGPIDHLYCGTPEKTDRNS